MADGGPIIQGVAGWATNLTQTPTSLSNVAPAPSDGTGLYLFGSASGRALYAVGNGANNAGVQSYSWGGDGVVGYAQPTSAPGSAGVRGSGAAPDGAGVLGSHQSRVGVWGQGPIGVVGQSEADYGIGVEGDASGRGAIGVFGEASGGQGSVGVYATAPLVDSAALQVNGRAVFSSSGKIVVPAGATSAAQGGLSLSTAAFVLATLQQNLPNISVRAAVPDPATGTVTVYLTAPAPVDASVGWMAVN
ncbi:MAG TPA: hypothetical protein VEH31_21415 [Streptosporangiaceae bacterium]|nr:hypothetical protein [Streptosporangiaceae bacterium]